ncbi:MAG: MBL fold metallo-hydrolase [Chloroflexi bacterium]|nr:MBL fold metallo-hydrolase [Chloroflexota bacterium]
MAQVILLGTGAALSDAARENMYLLVKGERGAILIDCAGSPIQHLLKLKIDLHSIDDVILTHHHPDHLYGLPIFLMDLWLAGRKKELRVHGLPETLNAAHALMEAFEWQSWKPLGFYPLTFNPLAIAERDISLILTTPEFSVSAARTQHTVPSIALRIMSKRTAQTVAYSSDTEKCDAVIELAHGADYLLHEATSLDHSLIGHSSARQAGSQARHAGVKTLVLVHLPPKMRAAKFRAAAAKSFKGKVMVGEDFMRLRF